jgi:hypothetical protein
MLPDSLEDTQRYFSDVFIRLKPYDNKNKKFVGDLQWVYVSTWRMDEDEHGKVYFKPYVLFQGAVEGYVWYRHRLTEEICDLSLPDSQYYFSGRDALFLKRKPVRQVQKALSYDNAWFTNPLLAAIPKNFQDGLYEDDDEGEGKGWLKILNTKVPDYSFEYAREMLLRDENLLSMPLKKRQWCLSKAPSTIDECVLWYKLSPVCLLKGHQGTLLVPEFKQEIVDNFPQIRI